MRAAWYSRNGEARKVLTVGDLPTPEIGAGEVRVRLATSGVNPSDVKSRRGRPLGGAPLIVPHSDGGGTIDAVGDGVPRGRLGERVWIWNGQWQRPLGTAAEYIVLPSALAVTLPDVIDFAAAACLGIPALTAFQAVHRLGDVRGKTVLVIGASSAVGHYVTQIATRHAGAKVVGTIGSAEKAAHARAAGASETIDYKREPVAERVRALTGGRGADAVVDMDFSSTAGLLAQSVVVPHGTVVTYGSNSADDVAIPFRKLLADSIELRFVFVYELTADDRRRALETVTTLLSRGHLDHTIGARFPLDRIAEAHEAVESGSVLGNVVLDIA